MAREYRTTSEKIDRYKAVCHIDNPDDVKLFGLNGYIWKCANGRYGARILNHKVANRHFPLQDYKLKKDQDRLVYTDQIVKLVKLMKVPVAQEKQLELAEAFDRGEMVDFGPCRYV